MLRITSLRSLKHPLAGFRWSFIAQIGVFADDKECCGFFLKFEIDPVFFLIPLWSIQIQQHLNG
jgi:hypothetical protein